MSPKRAIALELLAFGISVAVLATQYPGMGLGLQRAVVSALHSVARVAGTAAMKVEANYRFKVAP